MIKGYADHARTLCDPQYLQDELQNIEDVFMDNGYTRKEVRKAMKERKKRRATTVTTNKEDYNTRGAISIPNIPTFTRAYNRIARDPRFKTTTRADNKVKDLSFKAKTPLGDKNKNVVYNIPYGCGKYSYTGETDRKWKTRKNELMDKV